MSQFSEFTKIPVEIKARKLTQKTLIKTLEGQMVGNKGDWLIQGVNGELYPCKDDIFKKTYRPSSCNKSKCSLCALDHPGNRDCDTWEVCTFEWKQQGGTRK